MYICVHIILYQAIRSILLLPLAIRLLPLGVFFLDAAWSQWEKCPKRNGLLVCCVKTAEHIVFIQLFEEFSTIWWWVRFIKCVFLLRMFVHFTLCAKIRWAGVVRQGGVCWAGMIERKPHCKSLHSSHHCLFSQWLIILLYSNYIHESWAGLNFQLAGNLADRTGLLVGGWFCRITVITFDLQNHLVKRGGRKKWATLNVNLKGQDSFGSSTY